jgi:hypothetical protein
VAVPAGKDYLPVVIKGIELCNLAIKLGVL